MAFIIRVLSFTNCHRVRRNYIYMVRVRCCSLFAKITIIFHTFRGSSKPLLFPSPSWNPSTLGTQAIWAETAIQALQLSYCVRGDSKYMSEAHEQSWWTVSILWTCTNHQVKNSQQTFLMLQVTHSWILIIALVKSNSIMPNSRSNMNSSTWQTLPNRLPEASLT